jgi:phosphoserine phosphatase
MSFSVICFDCDSTLSKIEGIDELAKRFGLGEETAELTELAMDGFIALEEVYAKRLSLIKPDHASIDWLAGLYIAEMVEGVKELFASLASEGKEVHIISGGLRPAILPLAAHLGVPETRVHAVDIFFNDDGSYKDYETDSPLATTTGKARVVEKLNTLDSIVMIGDGITDMEAKYAGAYTIGFGGVIDRRAVRERADVFINDASLLAVLPYLC